jgi:D-arabinose 1-dehydrogenase-like Zn-dependent alcohol dehydrogenase
VRANALPLFQRDAHSALKMKIGVVGLGGLGHMGVKFAHALGAHAVVFTTSPPVAHLHPNSERSH